MPRSRRSHRFIQVFNRYLQPGGEENSVARIADHLAKAGHDARRFWRSSMEWTMTGAPSKLRQPFLLWRNAAVLNQLAALHRDVKPDAWILHNVLPVVSLGVYQLARELNVPIIQWLHNYRPISPSGTLRAGTSSLAPEDRWRTLKEIAVGAWHGRVMTAWLAMSYARVKRRGDFSSVRAWITVSDEMRRLFERASWPPHGQLFTLRHSWDIEEYPSGGNESAHFLFLGRMIEEKGVRFLVDLWRDKEFASIPLVMAGQGALADELRATLPSNIRWVGHVVGDEKARLIRDSRAILFPALWQEPLSTVAYEAYQAGKPVVSSNIGGMKEIVFDGRTGRLVAPGNSAEWKTAILDLWRDRQLAERLGGNGRRWLEGNVSPAAWNEQFDQILAKVLA